ncbi:hypothetical protein ES319_D06G214200v1 [Gossypium barbadense]|uniref:J domain-containing protein n=1 Tax=Gossypium barbadense TaxID=3634 RepID=A0A5J5R8T8_GOSBA|nr:hypothetical protein ES319_D06G214200v1 [Gossypium barbadense]
MAVRTSIQLISYSQELVDGQPLYVSSNCLPVKALKYEPAGHAFHNAALKLFGCEEDDTTEVDDQKVGNDKEHVYMPSSDSYSNKGKKKSGADGKQQDHYALLGLSHLRYLATEDQIRKSYREAALRHHPDKLANLLLAEETEAAKQAKKDEIENHFKSIQEAYEILIDPIKRRIYDSTDEFDDEIPTECAPQDFFKVFGPAFMRNGRWSVTQPIPSLGDDSTSLKDVDNFYNFWYSFKSWREFPHADEYDLEQSESRDHKRWMERQNAKLSEKARKEEYARIRALVDNAYKRDPRILRRKEEEKAEKQRKKEAKVRAKQLQEEEAARAAEEERRRKEEEEKRAAEAALQHKKNKEKEKKLLRKERTRLRALSAPVLSQHLLDLSEEDNAPFFFIKHVLNCQESSNIGFVKAMPPSISTASRNVTFAIDIVVVSSTKLYWDMCLRCAKVADIIECEGHQHFLFFDFKYREKCNGCGANINKGAFRCGKCRFALDFGCLTLPHSAIHKIDEHKLKLTYHDDKEQSYCDICEKYRDPSFGIILVQSVILLLISNVFLDTFHFSKMGSHFLIITSITMILNFLGRSRATLNALIVVSFAKKKFSSVKRLHATILSTTNTNVVGVTKPKALW